MGFFMDKRNRKRRSIAGLLLAALLGTSAMGLTGCRGSELTKQQIVLTTGFDEGEIFRMKGIRCMKVEALVYLLNMYDQYDEAYGEGIWDITMEGGTTLVDRIKQTVLARLAKIKMMNLMAQEKYQLSLSAEEEERLSAVASAYYGSLDADEIRALGDVTKEQILNMYREYALAEKVYELITRDVNSQVSDDEARTILVQQITLHAYSVLDDGTKRPYSEYEWKQLRNTAQGLLKRIRKGEDFEKLALSYNDEEEMTIGVMAGKSDPAVVEACSVLAEGEVSDVVETEDGVHIYRCISTFDREETEARKVEILQQRKKEAFDAVYKEFAATQDCYLNEELWNAIDSSGLEGMNTVNFFDLYSQTMNKMNDNMQEAAPAREQTVSSPELLESSSEQSR